MAERKMAKVRKLFKFHKSTTDLSEWNKNDDKLLKAVERGDVDKVETLMNKKTLLPTKPGPKGLSVFHWAALSGQLPIIELFLSHRVDINCTDLLGHTALHLAAKYGWPQMVDKLLQLGANKHSHDSDHMTAIHHACGSAHLPCVEVLIQHGASVNGKDKSGRTPMFYCAQGGDAAMCKLLLDHGADPNIQDHLSRTALIFAAGKGHREVVELLLKRGADPEYKDKDGVKAIEYAVRGDHNMKDVFDQAPTRASWNVPTASGDNGGSNGEDGSKSTLMNDIVRQFSGGGSPDLEEKLTSQKSKEVHSPVSSSHSSPHSRDNTPPTSSTKEQTTQEAYKELEEEHELLTEELRVLRIAHIKLKDKVEFLTERSNNKENGKGEDSQRIKVLEAELHKAKELHSIEQEKTKDLETKLDKFEQKLHMENQSDGPSISDNWGDSDDELFGNNNNNEKSTKQSKEKASQHVTLLRSQILTLQQENDHLKEKLQNDSGPNSPQVERLEKQTASSSEGVEAGVTNGPEDLNGLKKEKLDLMHEIETLKAQATSFRQSQLTHSVSVFSEGESGIHLNGERSPSPRDEQDNSHPDASSLQEECETLRETIKKMQVAYSALVEAGDKLQLEYDDLYNEKSNVDAQLHEVEQDKEDLLRENDFLSADNLHEDLERLINELETLQERNKDLEAVKADLERQLKNSPENGGNSGEDVSVTMNSEERQLLTARCQELEENAAQLKQDHAIVIEEIQSVQEQYNELQMERDQIQQELELSQDDVDKVTQQYDLIQQEYGQLEQDYAELLADKGKLEQDFMEMETNRARESPGLTISQHNQDILLQQHSILKEEKDLLESKVIELHSANETLEKEVQTFRTLSTSNEQHSVNNIQSIKINSAPSSTEKDKQIRSLQIKISRLQQNLTDIERKHRDTVNTYRTHLVSAVQGHMDPEVQKAIHHIIEIRGTEQFC